MLDIQHLTRRYQNKLAVSDLSLTFEKGKTYALLGPNGSGKTTLMKMIAGLTKQTSGEITLDGIPVGPETKKHIAYMPTESYFYSYMSIADAGKYYADFFEDFDERRYEEALQRMELNPKDKIRTLSSGMNAKVRLALTLSRDAQVMMFDEPLNGVDILTRKQVVDEIIRNRENGRTMIISTHLVDELNAYIDVAIFMKNGVLERIGDRAAKAPGETYSCSCAVGGLRDWYAAQQALADDPDGAAQWLTLDEGYRAFAEAQFLELTPEAAGAAQALLGSEMQGKTLPEILQAIRQTLTEHFVYDESVSTQNGTQDFFQYVQSVTARGYSVHYATAAVLMLRYCGVPARYAEGYYLSGQDAASGEQTFELDETHAHAWAEYYLTGVGWVPFEVTPGYVEAEDLGAGGEAGGKQYENTQLPPVVEQPEQQAPQEETQRSFRWWLAAIPLAAALLALVLCQLWRRRRLHRRIAAMAADEPREAVTQLYGYAVFLLARTGAAPPAGLEQARQDNAEAMFSGHDIPAEKAAAMQHFVQETLQACRAERNLFQRFADRWVHIWY